MEILKANFGDSSAAQTFTKSLRETGFGVIAKHSISPDLIKEVYAEWESYFASKEKFDDTFDPVAQDGYFPFGSENAKDSQQKDLKEFYHIYPGKKFPQQLSSKTIELRDALIDLGSTLLSWIEKETPSEIRSRYSMPLPQMIEKSDRNLFRIIHYPPLSGDEPKGSIRAAAHEDINLITLLTASTAMGLQVRDTQGQWVEVPGDFGDIVVNVGDMLQMASDGFYKSTTHRVVNPTGETARRSRYSMPLFVHPRGEVALSRTITAEQYLNQRLKEIGLKS